MPAWIITTILLATVAAMHIIMKIMSREPPPGKKIPLTIEDSVFWVDWVVTAAVALSLSLLSSSRHDEEDRPKSAAGDASSAATAASDNSEKLIGLLFVFGVGMLVLPLFIRYFCYDGNGKIKGWPYVLLANAAGMTILLVAVTTGVKIYGS